MKTLFLIESLRADGGTQYLTTGGKQCPSYLKWMDFPDFTSFGPDNWVSDYVPNESHRHGLCYGNLLPPVCHISELRQLKFWTPRSYGERDGSRTKLHRVYHEGLCFAVITDKSKVDATFDVVPKKNGRFKYRQPIYEPGSTKKTGRFHPTKELDFEDDDPKNNSDDYVVLHAPCSFWGAEVLKTTPKEDAEIEKLAEKHRGELLVKFVHNNI